MRPAGHVSPPQLYCRGMSPVFGMISTRRSATFTALAVESFLRTTPLDAGSELLLIDNDGSIDEAPPGVHLAHNPEPRSFAVNMNAVLRRARRRRTDAVLLNNDLVFTTDWFPPVAAIPDAIVSPISNAEVQYTHGDFTCELTMELAHYRGRESALEAVAAYNRRQPFDPGPTHAFAFFCTRIPLPVIEAVGFLDEGYLTGGEDKDYCVRAHLLGIPVRWAPGSFVLHFQGRSTWKGAETAAETALRNDAYIQRFGAKWGEALTRLFILNQAPVLDGLGLRDAWDAGEFGRVVSELARRKA